MSLLKSLLLHYLHPPTTQMYDIVIPPPPARSFVVRHVRLRYNKLYRASFSTGLFRPTLYPPATSPKPTRTICLTYRIIHPPSYHCYAWLEIMVIIVIIITLVHVVR